MDRLTGEAINGDAERDASSPENSSISPLGISRYGRTRKPKISEDFCDIDHAIQTSEKSVAKPGYFKSPKKPTRTPKSANKSTKFLHITGDSIVQEDEAKITSEKPPPPPPKVPPKEKLQNATSPPNGTRFETKPVNLDGFNAEFFEPSPIDVSKVLKIISCATGEPKLEIDKKPSRSVLKTYCNKRKSFNKVHVIESFALPDEPMVPLYESGVIKPTRIAEIDVEIPEPESVSLANGHAINSFWEPHNGSKISRSSLDLGPFEIRQKPDVKKEETEENVCEESHEGASHVGELPVKTDVLGNLLNNNEILQSPPPVKPKKIRNDKKQFPPLEPRVLINRKAKNMKHFDGSDVTSPTKSKQQITKESSDDLRKKISKKINEALNNVGNTTMSPNKLQVIVESQQESLCNSSVPKIEVDDEAPNLPIITDNVINISDMKNRISNKLVGLERLLSHSETPNEVKDEYDCDVAIKDEVVDLTLIKSETVEYVPGEILWAKVGSHPYWPCLTIKEPGTEDFRRYRKRQTLYHVRFFGDNGRRSWVPLHNLLPYKTRDDLLNGASKHDNKLPVQNTKKHKYWSIAVDEAESLKDKDVEERFNFFDDQFILMREKKKAIPKILAESFKSPVELNPDVIATQRSKSLPSLNEKRAMIVDKMGRTKGEALRRVTRSSLQKNPFFVEKSIKVPEAMESTPVEISRRLNRTCQDVLGSECSYSDTDSGSKISVNSPVPCTFESQVVLYKRNNLFKGVPKDRVCQICEKDGVVVKCKGPCSGYYHIDCAHDAKNFPNDTDSSKGVNVTVHNNEVQINTADKNVQIEGENRVTDCDLQNVEIIQIKDRRRTKNLPQLVLTQDSDFKDLPLLDQIDRKMKEVMKRFENNTLYADSTTDYTSSEESLTESLPSDANKITTNALGDPNTQILKKNANDVDFKCNNCSEKLDPVCFVCHEHISKKGSDIRQKCSIFPCGKFYHPECLKQWPQTQWSLIATTRHKNSDTNLDTFVCPLHVCHTCVSDDPRAAISRCQSNKVVKCLRCPATYHTTNYCVPAGTEILSTTQIVCPRHLGLSANTKRFRKKVQTINTTWCFICSQGGDLICCETCPTSVHGDCLNINPAADDTFTCEDCETGRFPLYDEIVWVKLGNYRWWPAVVLFPNEVPDNVANSSHNKGEFVVKFFGTHDHYWISRGRVFLFQEGDSGGQGGQTKKKVDAMFRKSVEEATLAHRLKRDFKVSLAKEAEIKTGLKPPPYIKIKINRPVGNVRLYDGNVSNTTPCECDPKQESPCGPDSDCLNRLLLTECNPEVCPAGNNCLNQNFEKRNYPPLVPYKTESRGWGLKSLEHISKGQFIIEYVGEMIDEQEYQRRIKKMHEQKEENYYFLTIDKDRMIDAGPKGNVARFMNHCCQPNCETQKWTVNGDTRVGLFATADIPVNTELTFNYNLECVGKEKKICKCGAPNCSGFIGEKTKQDESQKKIKKPANKIKKKRESSQPAAVVNNPCFKCGRTGDVGACHNKICTKFYHLECVNLESWPENKWACPWHNCNVCSKRTIRCCDKCINSYCPVHSEGNVRYDKLLGFVCTLHDPNTESQPEVAVRKPRSQEIVMKITGEDDVTSTTCDELGQCLLEVNKNLSKSESQLQNVQNYDSSYKSNRALKARTSTPIRSSASFVDPSPASDKHTESFDSPTKRKRGRPRKIRDEHHYKKTKLDNSNSVDVVKRKLKVPDFVDKATTQNEVILLSTVPARHLRTSKVNLDGIVLKRHKKQEKDLPIRKRSTLRCDATI